MKQNMRTPAPNGEYIRITCREGRISETILSYEEMQALEPQEYDFHYNQATGEIQIQPEHGEPLLHEDGIPGVGPTCWKFLEELMWAGEYRTVEHLYLSTNDESFADKDNVQALLTRLRQAFGESGTNPWFFKTRKYGTYAIRWDKKRSWQIIEKLATPSSSAKDEVAES